ncbi:MAG: nicotinate (nicotinamide) nucleotide adenylyltransferase [Planctomycetes bacterium]|jgi:nicotinate-nucleotide adenylyltransferase|nr:nicotinate (nicotinamide) nucleotide adenylyltransferase [Planctomycetota bacterium]
MTEHGPVVVFGGSFDPPTRAHVELPPLAAAALGASRLLYVPAAISPHKTETPPTPADHRVAMLRLVLPEGAEIDTRELDRGGPSFAIETLESIQSELGDSSDIRLLIGTDQAAVFHRWHRWQDILGVAAPAVMVRGDDGVEQLLTEIELQQGSGAANRWRAWILNLPRMTHSSTRVRAGIESDSLMDDDVHPSVAAYIEAHDLYRGCGCGDVDT